GGADEASEADVIDALMFAHREAQPVLDLIERMRQAVGKPKREFTVPKLDEAVAKRVAEIVDPELKQACVIREKKARYEAYGKIKEALVQKLGEELGAERYLEIDKLVKQEFEERKAVVVRNMVLDEGRRIDGRDTKT